MVVIALASHDVQRNLPSLQAKPTLFPSFEQIFSTGKQPYTGIDPGLSFQPFPSSRPSQPPEISPTQTQRIDPPRPAIVDKVSHPEPVPDEEDTGHVDDNAEAGPSRAIPPPPTPRRHRSGAIMSRVRAHSGTPSYKSSLNMTASKSWGDLSVGLAMSPPDQPGDDESQKRFFSEGDRSRRPSDSDETMWDNSARFYHRMHSRPASRSTSRETSPDHSPASSSRVISTHPSPIFVRRNLSLPQQNLAPPPGASLSASLSPNHHFLQQHLPPTFPENPASAHDSPNHAMVILTPTTQEWKELKAIGRMEGENFGNDSGSDSGESQGGAVDEPAPSLGTIGASLLLGPEGGQPSPERLTGQDLESTPKSVDVPADKKRTPDPGSPIVEPAESPSPARPVFNPVIIAPSPIFSANERMPHPAEPSPNQALEEDRTFAFGSSPPEHSSLHRFASIGRRDSLKADRPSLADVPKIRSKRELEREKLFRLVDEEIQSDPTMACVPDWGMGVQEVGAARRLSINDVRPFTANSADRPTPPFGEELHLVQTTGGAHPIPSVYRAALLAATNPSRPSPLHASPMTAMGSLHDSASASATPSSSSSGRTSPLPSAAASQTNLASIRDYARALSTHHSNPISRASSPSPPQSPRSPRQRKRDTTRKSLVAGRLIQAFALPPSTSLPPNGSSLAKKSSLTSFSPFRSPSLFPVKSNTSIESAPSPGLFRRGDSSISVAQSILGAPSDGGSPTGEIIGGVGGRGIDDYVILAEAGKGAYGLVMRAKVKGPGGEPVGEVIIKYIIKNRILADCWKKHKVLGPIPVELFVMDQVRHLIYHPPLHMHPWDPSRPHFGDDTQVSVPAEPASPDSAISSPASTGSGMFSPTQKYIAAELRSSPERGHPNICKLLDFFEDREFYYLVMPRFGSGIDLFDSVETNPAGLPPFEVRSIVGQLTDAVRFLHSNGIVHRDIKDENVILDGSGNCQLIDFGSAAQWRPGKRWDTFSGTLHYASPEILRGEMYSGKEQDVWALGVVAYVLLVGETPFDELPDEVLLGLGEGTHAKEALDARCADQQDEGREGDGGGRLGDAADWVRRCLDMEVGERPSAEQLCAHRFLKGEGGWVGKRGWAKKT